MVVLWSAIAAVISALVVLRLSDGGWLPSLLVGLGVALAVAAAAEPLVGGPARRRACRPAARRRAVRTSRPAARAPRAVPRSRP
ncbi:hypothetical protein ACFQV2_04130 [Actinokineospora soli]|uniref:Uncharacterized protein n=1 Tax=Actinokineospora soli TaxID=1048753 RepID=A0ABW2TGU3_9PSEU